jgi:glycosyltransferase involved in cell wall biosynthesis
MIKSVADGPVRKQKVLIFTRKIDIGGTERHLTQVLPQLARTYEIAVFAIYSGGALEQELRDSGIKVLVTYSPSWKWLTILLGMVQMAFIMRLNRNAIIHFFLPEAYLLGGLCGIMLGHSKMIMSRRSLNAYQLRHPVLALLEKKLHRKMKIILGNSQAVLLDLIGEGVLLSRARLIYNGVFIRPVLSTVEKNSLRIQHNIGADDLVITVLANLFTYKGHKDLIDAMSLIAPKLAMPWHLLLVGRDEGEKSRLQLLTYSRGFSERILFLDEIKQIDYILQISDIGVLPSHQEGFSNSILESMAAGLPMVVTNVGGNPEAVLHEVTGLVVPAQNPYDLGQAIFSLACDPEKRKTYGDMGLRRVQEYFSIDACVASYRNVYDALSNESQRCD